MPMKPIIFTIFIVSVILASCGSTQSNMAEIYMGCRKEHNVFLLLNRTDGSYVYMMTSHLAQRDCCEVGGFSSTDDSLLLHPRHRIFKDSLEHSNWDADTEEKNVPLEEHVLIKRRNRLECGDVLYKIRIRRSKEEDSLVSTRNFVLKNAFRW